MSVDERVHSSRGRRYWVGKGLGIWVPDGSRGRPLEGSQKYPLADMQIWHSIDFHIR
jgi:hypothetical protein